MIQILNKIISNKTNKNIQFNIQNINKQYNNSYNFSFVILFFQGVRMFQISFTFFYSCLILVLVIREAFQKNLNTKGTLFPKGREGVNPKVYICVI